MDKLSSFGSSNPDITEEEIREKLGKHHGGDWTGRDLVRIESDQGRGGDEGVFFYFLTGSPPKGYAIYVPSLRLLSFYDAFGKRFRIMDEVAEIEEREETLVRHAKAREEKG
ncbi:hypothetical protein AKJ41_05350 [candidate division MSBL1 archaeon SCGC-AAA259O05]|uniref:Uncharacterized protein n=1 Tax=candidate division MSBL1 archaeon SCGC-AAA259O05 TaxID=1698271 RepID=A0A133UZ56_9EURY|nr:hypothetical protein AKJ41_05350 [candidate division MSBL1 archaeon SCGC-AAA259O05]